MVQRSDKHSAARKEKDGWVCTVCESESGDFELFEEAGEIEDCLARGLAAGVVPGTDDLVAWAEVERARDWMEQSRNALATMTPAVDKAVDQMNAFREALAGMSAVASPWYTDEMTKRRTTIETD